MLKRFRTLCHYMILATIIGSSGEAAAETILVHPGSSTIQEAIDRAAANDTVAISPGTYLENLVIQEKTGITLVGLEGPEKTIIDGDLKGGVVDLLLCEGTTTLTGLTFQRGLSEGNGGGVQCSQSNIVVDNCHFLDNEARNEGGGMIIYQAASYTIINCLFDRNTAIATAGLNVIGGVGVANNNLFRRNSGGLTVLFQFSSIEFHENIVVRNEAPRFGPVVFLYPMPGSMTGNTIAFNIGMPGSGALFIRSGRAQVERNLICNNTDVFGISFESPDNLVKLSGNNVWSNDAGAFTGQTPDDLNFEKDPLFCDAGNNDFTLRAASPCLPADEHELIGALGKGCP